MNLSTEYGFQFKKILHLLSFIDSEINIQPDEHGTVILKASSRRHKFLITVHLDETFFFTSSVFTYKWQRHILLDVFIWLHMLQNVGVKDSISTSWCEDGNLIVHVKNPQDSSIRSDVSIVSDIINRRVKFCSNTPSSSAGCLLESYSVKAPDTELSYLSELYREITISVLKREQSSTLSFNAKNSYSQVSIVMNSVQIYSKLNTNYYCSNFSPVNSKIFIECFTRALEITQGKNFEIHLLSDDTESLQISTLRIQFIMNQKLCFLTLDL
jgi:hypothetical protein